MRAYEINNLIVDKEFKVLIPQNMNTNYVIKKSSYWKNSIEIGFIFSEEIDYINLYLILKSYCLSTIWPVVYVCPSILNKKDEIVVFQKESPSFIKNIDFIKFKEWISYRLLDQEHYEKSEEFMNYYSILLIFNENIVYLELMRDNDILSWLKPNYPWNDQIINFFEKDISNLELVKKQNELLINQNKNLTKEVNLLNLKMRHLVNNFRFFKKRQRWRK